ncbi:sensor histidine kinase [Undibacterium flavidum]|uniref:histidine kinase n=1 Tax=Undibacterium flavidum TaxID=2762297 RepID=A0ABR6YBD4_9BURK|nr:HAMP domain-containing sensor histidine kinase [Undibacterium flavidum]MBC3873920.1 HAMP domain-containing histidine kinase [Undibacterium flavidum]
MKNKLAVPTTAHQLDQYALLEHGRSMCLAGQFDQLQLLLQQISQASFNPEQTLLLEVLMLYPGSASPPQNHTKLLQRAMNLHELAQALGSDLARAWIWEAMQLIQISLQLHHAALHSTAMAAEMFEHCARPRDAMSMRVSRCLIMIHCEMYREVIAMSETLLKQRELLDTIALVNLLRSSASAYYFLGNETDGDEAKLAWSNSLNLHQECLRIAQQARIDKFILISHTNIAVLSASLGMRKETNEHLLYVEGMQGLAESINISWSYWIRYCEILLLCQGAEFNHGWQLLLALANELATDNMVTAPVQDAVFKKIVRLGKQRGYFEIALDASERHLELSRQRRHLLSKTLSDTIDDVMAVPHLQQKNQKLSQQGYALEASLARRNTELSQALSKLQIEVDIRSQAEQALQRAHADLEEQVRQRTQELEQAMRLVMRQEKQLALSRLVVGVAHEMNTPLGNATIAASTMQHLCQNLLLDINGPSLSRSKLQNTLSSISEGILLLSRALNTASELVQRFRSLAIEQHQESLTEYDVSHRCQLLIEGWKNRFRQAKVEVYLQSPTGIKQIGYPNALSQVLDQLIDNAMRHALLTTQNPQLDFILSADETEICIEVSDNGLGIADENLQRIFEPFFSKQLGLDGIGLGLSVVHSLVTDLMQGRIKVENRVTSGLSVVISIPRMTKLPQLS